MKRPSDDSDNWESLRTRIIGLGERSLRKNYYPELQQRLTELERFRALLDQSNDAIFLVQISSGRFSDLNATAYQQSGYTREELLNLSARDLVPEETVAHINALANEPDDPRSREPFATVLYKQDGTRLPVEITARPVQFEGELFAVIVARDITERQRTEAELAQHREHLEELITERTQQLRESEQHFRRLFETMLQGVVYRDAEGRVISFNPAAERILGQAPVDLTDSIPIDQSTDTIREDGTPLPMLEHPAMVALRTGREVRDRVIGIYNPREQGYRWINVSAVPVFRSDMHRPDEVYTLFADITPHKRAEDEIRHLNQTLQERAIDLEAANDELEAFAYSVSHDLRAPLRHMTGFLEMLQAHLAAALDEQGQHYLTAIGEAVKRMEVLISDLLTFSRLGRQTLSKRAVDLNGLMQEILQELEPDIQGRAIQWYIRDLPVVTGDQAMLRVVLVNLLSNALKFTRSCTLAEIEMGCLPQREQEITIFVRDNGVGFDMAYAHNLFGVFQRLHSADKFEGTGIGLANVRRIIQRHGGQTWATGEIDHGATFYFSLPQAD